MLIEYLKDGDLSWLFSDPSRYQRSPFLLVAQSIIGAYVLWRTWRFTFLPILYPAEPKQLPYWIPC